MAPELEKSPSILAVLALLERELGPGALRIVDHWDADLCAIGVTGADPARRVYLSTWNRDAGRFFYDCETDTADGDLPFVVVDHGEDVDFAALLAAVRRHVG